jgi:fucose permease
VLVLNALLGLGTALAPLFVSLFDGLGFWRGLPLLSAILLAALLLATVRQPLTVPRPSEVPAAAAKSATGPPATLWLFAGFAVLYGICETMNGNWSQLYMTGRIGASAAQASLALTTFWAMVTVGRIAFAAVGRWVPARVTYHALPFVLTVSFALLAALPRDHVWSGVALFGLAGLGCSALLPLTISLGQEALTSMSAAIAGDVIAFYQIGYGIAAFGVGPLLDSGHNLSAVYGLSAVVAAVMGTLSFALAHGRPSPRRLHPLPTVQTRQGLPGMMEQ